MAEGAEAYAAAFRWLGTDASLTPPSSPRTLELGAKYTNGDECYPTKVIIGDFLRIVEQQGFDPACAMFLLPTTDGPCRYGQYAPYLKKILREHGYGGIQIFSPTSKNGYRDFGQVSASFMRTFWRAIVASDTLHRALLKIRPYERTPETSDAVFRESLAQLCVAIESSCENAACQMETLVECLTRARDRFHQILRHDDRALPLIGVVGEIFCRLNTFSNEDLIRRLEKHGAEVRLSQLSEWVGYANAEEVRRLHLECSGPSLEVLRSQLRSHVQRSDYHALTAPFREDFADFPEPEIAEILALAEPYLPASGAMGEMVMSVGMASYLARHGADGIVDISPFTCMNGIVSEAIYPKLSADLGGIPIRSFYFDGTQSELDRDLGIYLELVRTYRNSKPKMLAV
jgi:predicted nucleotide-binding protein (sugar kinase/HSP70/actin superfamily)